MNIDINLNNKPQSQTLVIFGLAKEKIIAPKQYQVLINKLIAQKEFAGKETEVYSLPVFDNETNQQLILVGLGKKDNCKPETLSKTIGNLVKVLENKKKTRIDLLWPAKLPKNYKSQEAFLKMLIKYFYLCSYKFNHYKKDKNKAVYLQAVNIIGLPATIKIKKVITEAKIIAKAINYTRELNNLPANKVTPQFFASEAKQIEADNKKLTIKILTLAEIKKLGMGGLLGVSAGSQHLPQFIILEYLNGPAKTKPIVFVGKTITFDSGGISLKPGEGMDEMKMDMSGGAAVFGAIKAISQLNLKVNVVGLIPACENMPSGSAYKPGDILQAMNKKTIEVLNTDAEGRIILADALSYAAKYKPKYVVDLATLTGACMVSLGTLRAGLFGNDQALIDKIYQRSNELGELTWPMPLDQEYSEQIKSKIADVRNTATSKYGGAITAAAFLKEFVSYPWVHLDIAGVAWADGNSKGLNVGSTGFGVQLLVELVK